MKAKCIVNPTAGNGQTAKRWKQLLKTIEKTGFDLVWEYTKYRGHGYELTTDAVKNGYEMIIAVGGDGTINEVVNGIGETGVTLGIIPTGTGNDFARTINIPLDPVEACITLGTKKTKAVDLGKVNGKYFLNIAGVGYDALVAQEINRHKGKLTGKIAYLLAMARVFLNFKPSSVRISSNQETHWSKVTLVAIANAKYYGGGMAIAPRAQIDDGKFDVIIVEAMTKWELIKSLPLLLKGEHLKHPKVSYFEAEEIELASREAMLVHADGEIIGQLPISFKVIPKAINIIVSK